MAKKVQVLDCTLRDGGYCNNWNFGENNIRSVIHGLAEANIDIIECGFLSYGIDFDKDKSKFQKIGDISCFLPKNRGNKQFVCMINYGEYPIDALPEHEDIFVDGIRVAFDKKDADNALKYCQQVKEKGYKVFIQAMVSLNYTDTEFIQLIHSVNTISPYAFYIVDSFGLMKQKDLVRLFYIVENNLDKSILIGYHAHNNMQLAFSNAQTLVELPTVRDLIIDSSIYGMGRGAGNLNTELFVQYLNGVDAETYNIKPLLRIIDEVILKFYLDSYWGYSLPNYLSAAHNAHPNYAKYLDERKTLTIKNMDEIFDMMDVKKKSSFDKKYIEELYKLYMNRKKSKEVSLKEFAAQLVERPVLVIAPGKNSELQKDKIIEFVQNHKPVILSVNFNYTHVIPDYIFVSNLRRYQTLGSEIAEKIIVTSNIDDDMVYLKIGYSELLNDTELVEDNAGLMLLQLIIHCKATKVYLAGFDGYSFDSSANYIEEDLEIKHGKKSYLKLNDGMKKVLSEYAKQIEIEFITDSLYINA